jgi:GTP-binding protein Era
MTRDPAHPLDALVPEDRATRAGFVTVAGKPNAGKSTLLNLLVGEKLAITSPKAQSTRHRVVGLRTEDGVQMVVLDTPGLLDPRDLLHEAMRTAALGALRDADVVVYVVDVAALPVELLRRWLEARALQASSAAPWPSLSEAAGLERALRAPVLTALNKVDLLPDDLAASLEQVATADPSLVLLSAVRGDGLSTLVRRITDALPESAYLYPPDEVSTQPMRFFCAEFVRETAMEQLGDELPHALACEIEEYREGSTPLYIRAVLYVERDSQKRIVIGAGGQQIKKLGRVARQKIEQFVGMPVYLDLWVKVLANWRKKRGAVTRFGYGDPAARPPA